MSSIVSPNLSSPLAPLAMKGAEESTAALEQPQGQGSEPGNATDGEPSDFETQLALQSASVDVSSPRGADTILNEAAAMALAASCVVSHPTLQNLDPTTPEGGGPLDARSEPSTQTLSVLPGGVLARPDLQSAQSNPDAPEPGSQNLSPLITETQEVPASNLEAQLAAAGIDGSLDALSDPEPSARNSSVQSPSEPQDSDVSGVELPAGTFVAKTHGMMGSAEQEQPQPRESSDDKASDNAAPASTGLEGARPWVSQAPALESDVVAADVDVRLGSLNQTITEHVVEFRRMDRNSMSVVIRPDDNSEWRVELKRDAGRILVEIRFERGDMTPYIAAWDNLRSDLAARGIDLGSLDGSGGGMNLDMRAVSAAGSAENARLAGDSASRDSAGRDMAGRRESEEPLWRPGQDENGGFSASDQKG
ncbi:MAG: hypothetical protein FJ405_11575, partial [Verrucomicrobia bacterium]|nr:hypothetical protein [Verrucomicrobiota bacterium]